MMKKTKSSERAQTTAEFVLVLPFLLLLFFLIVDFGWLLKNWIVVTNSVREATRCQVVDSCPDDLATADPAVVDLLKKRITQGLFGNIGGDPEIDIEYVDNPGTSAGIGPGDSIVVCVRAKNKWISPIVPILALISGGAGVLSDDGLPIAAREEMILEVPPLVPHLPEDGACEFS